ncbi:sensor domain-containing diguanylate cyclase [Ureibacillus chungkukjangi]|uniref:Diguanylate cyclase (GGDEF)-like protein n=1 Tax=Ureibacillus chungkukjangi TaxID=1202712 RepID=A0A318TZN8_9BACL|nr:sensor domain-containing diguanylate cyclase [Ureibacillus chungkukjangi]PYF08448.1 diguanylate cyclase (GGDEF)-like protein [Ureibacillus chungkukjangi]
MKKEIKLNVAISILVVIAVMIATVIELVSSTNALKNSLATNYLESNYNYSNKIAEGIQYVTIDLQHTIIAMAELSKSPHFDQNQLDILKESENGHFNSIFITDENGVIQLMSPETIDFKERETSVIIQAGRKINPDVVEKSLTTKKPFITEPYITTSGTVLILITAPLLNKHGIFEGMMVGTIYLENENAIKTVLSSNKYNDGSFVYAVDQNGRIICHPDTNKVYENVSGNSIVKAVRGGESGYQVTDEAGNEYFAGYSYIENLGWGVILLTPTSIIHGPLNNLVFKIITQSTLILLIILVIAMFLVKQLTKPLTRLAEYSERLITTNKLNHPNDELIINSNIYEINQLYRRMRIQLLKLNQEIQLDGLTGVANRKAFDIVINEWMEQKQPFSLVMLDIDNFKQINDTYGHLVGDDVLKFLTSILISFSREGDLCFRYGGEEFGILLKGKEAEKARSMAEHFRLKIASTESPTGKPITVSLGLTAHQPNDDTPKAIIERADKALYQSKQAGKNRVTVYRED